jgi:hypothetical protein
MVSTTHLRAPGAHRSGVLAYAPIGGIFSRRRVVSASHHPHDVWDAACDRSFSGIARDLLVPAPAHHYAALHRARIEASEHMDRLVYPS